MAAADRESGLKELLGELAAFRAVTLEGEPSDRALAKAAGVSPTTVGTWLRGAAFPQQIDPLVTIVEAVRAQAHRAGQAEVGARAGLWDLQRWREAHFAEAQRRAGATGQAVQGAQARAVLEGARPGTPLEQVLDPFAVEVHRPITVNGASGGLLLPPYVRREHDDRLGRATEQVLDGASAMAVLVAGSSAGKTRALWEGLGALRRAGGWRLWHPYDPTRPEAALRELDRVGPRTVVWLNETQDYLGGEAGERVAAKLRALLTDASRGPVLVLGTLWPEHHAALTGRPGSQVRHLLDGAVIEVPETFTGIDLAALRQAADTDLRLAEAIEEAEDGHVTQYLAGGPELLDRLATADPAAKALMWAAMDARRLGHRTALPLPMLEQAALAYLTDLQHDRLGEDWLEQALAYTSRACKGARGPLTRIRASSSRADPSRRGRGPGRGRGRPPAPAGDHGEVPVYRLADYLDQHARDTRADQIPPIGFWVAAAAHAHPDDQHTLGHAAWDRGLYRDAAQLLKNATTHGSPWPARTLIDHLNTLHPTDHRPAHQAATHATTHITLDDPGDLAFLLGHLRDIGAHEQVAALLARDPAAHVTLDEPGDLAELLDQFREVGADEQVAALLARDPAAHIPLDHPGALARLLAALREVGADEQVATLLARDPAAHIDFGNPNTVAYLLDLLRKMGVEDQVAVLADLAAAHVAFDAPYGLARLLRQWWKQGAEEQVAALLARDPAAHIPLDDPSNLAILLGQLQEMGMKDQVAALADRVAAHVPLHDLGAIAELLGRLREVGADEQVDALADRVAAHVSLHDPGAVANLLGRLREVGADEQAAVLLARRPAAHVTLDDPYAVANLLSRLWRVGVDGQAAALVARAPAAHVVLDDPYAVANLLGRLREVGADEQVDALADRVAAHVSLHDPGAIANLLGRLREVGAHEQAAALVARNPAAHATPDNQNAVAALLGRLREVGAHEQVATLTDRVAAHVAHAFKDPYAIADLLGRWRLPKVNEKAAALLASDPAAHLRLRDPDTVAAVLDRLRKVGAHEQVAALLARDPAAHVTLTTPVAVADLLDRLLEVGADEQAAALAARLPTAGMFAQFQRVADHHVRYRFGRDPDGRPAEEWGWDDLE
ncbi:hypothetical protein [Actinomadura sp. NEAU-AAG7]|uniref:hypothetical protein n=1 Tax=Actinomadura sp. NEAU-AAG7 TaxID=2839640 RepID=UPI001BE4B371|nr:hypothetical protein [Actinomadura sp. NEAU-AAG7]MBT2212566.1 hypothetical protein [Actinomadura sp. NEAU-AAG7]